MASQLYARYVPPVKKGFATTKPVESPSSAPSLDTLPVIEVPTTQHAPSTQPDASSTYSRYLPPITHHKSPATPPQNPTSNGDVTPSQKRKHEDVAPSAENGKKAKKPKRQITATHEGARADEASQGKEMELSKQDDKRVKKPKRKVADPGASAKRSIDKDSVSDEDDARHKALLSKRAKSLKKSEKVARLTAQLAAESGESTEQPIPEESLELHPLGPLPQPEPVPESTAKPTFATLPPWLASPIRVLPSATCVFSDLGIPNDATAILQSKGFKSAFAVQAAVLPLLLKSDPYESNDVLVSAATGSGKTLSYVLPMVGDIATTRVPRLRGLIVMPTRELVQQAREICEICANAYSAAGSRRINTGIAVGNQTLKAEQASLMNEEQRYDPEEYRRRERKANARWETASDESDDDSEFHLLDEEYKSNLPDHILTYSPKVDVLICTPGRLVEHLRSTPGFTLEHVSWLVVDEADKLLDQSFQQWLDVVMDGLSKDGGHTTRKVILSATITRDLGQLSALKLRRPKLVMLEGSASLGQSEKFDSSDANLTLPETLSESAVKVADDGDKPLYLMQLLGTILPDLVASRSQIHSQNNLLETAESDSDSTDSSSGDDSSSSSDDGSSDDGDGDTSSDGSSPTASASFNESRQVSNKPSSSSKVTAPTRGILVFTKSNENAVRLSRLIALMDPSLASNIGTLTSTIRNSERRKTLSEVRSGNVVLLVASDLVARGLDLANLAHVINYDMPTSLTNYVHRVGRTARAGNEGHAWTLFTNTEARWFWNEIARSNLVSRPAGKVARHNIDKSVFGEKQRGVYETALATLGQEARRG